jgi:hypothetical protein
VNSVAFSPDGELLVSSSGGTARCAYGAYHSIESSAYTAGARGVDVERGVVARQATFDLRFGKRAVV